MPWRSLPKVRSSQPSPSTSTALTPGEYVPPSMNVGNTRLSPMEFHWASKPMGKDNRLSNRTIRFKRTK